MDGTRNDRRLVSARVAGAALAAIFAASACGGGEETMVDLRIRPAPGEMPFAGASELRLFVEQDQAIVHEETLRAGTRRFDFGPVPLGEGFVLHAEAIGGGLVLARGRSFPFDVSPAGATHRPDVLIGSLGRFARPIDPATAPPGSLPDARVVAASATDTGAVLATSTGSIYEYVAHDAIGASFTRLARIGEREGATWASLPRGRLLAIGGAIGGATLVGADGAILGSLSDGQLGDQREGVAAAALPSGDAILLAGGAAGPTSPAIASVTRIDVATDGTLAATALPGLPAPLRDAVIVALPVQDETSVATRALVVGGSRDGVALSEAHVLDPAGVDPPVTLDLGQARLDAAVAVAGIGLAIVAGGRTLEGVALDETILLSVRPSALDRVSPAPDRLFPARYGAAIATWERGLLVLAGGHGADGTALESADLLDLTTFPGRVNGTGPLPSPFGSPAAVVLDDRTVLVADPDGLAIYFPTK